ncbi:MAG: amino acid ABC transporter ATP-binding protein [Micromonosporaceae bacterium]
MSSDVGPGHTGSCVADAPSTPPADTAPPTVLIDSVSKAFGRDVVVQDVSLGVSKGEVVSIIGPSGAGKSTLLRCINLLETPTRGRIVVEGRQACGPEGCLTGSDLADLRRRVGMVFQSFNLFPHLTVLKNISLPQMRVLGRSQRQADARSMDLLEQVGLADKAGSHPSRCSGGQQQRIAIARALALDPTVMLFDEPTSALDAELGLEVLAVMRKLASDGMTMIVVTHELHFAEEVSDTVVVMANGKILESGPPKTLLREPTHPRTRRFLRAILER